MEECPMPSTRTGVLEKMCIFCKGRSRKHFPNGFEQLSSCETKEAQDKLINAAKQQGDGYFLREFEHIDFVAKEVMYHNMCKGK